jgi:hypothetical protein
MPAALAILVDEGGGHAGVAVADDEPVRLRRVLEDPQGLGDGEPVVLVAPPLRIRVLDPG